MKVKVLLADIFDLTTPTAMDQRMECAFGVDGQDFWGKFFPCNDTHPNNRIVYLFTERQVRILHNWLTEKCMVYGENIRKNLDFSRQKLFRDVVWMPDGSYANIIRAGYIKRGSGNRFEFRRLFFGLVPGIKGQNYTDFFDGGFRDDPSPIEIMEILAIRSAIEREFGDTGKNDEKWLRYLGPRVFNNDHPLIEYCGDINPCFFKK